MAGITSSMATSFKAEMFASGHCFNATVTPTGTWTTAFTVTALSTIAGLAVGMALSGTGIPAGAVIASIDSATQLTMSKASTAGATGATLTAAGDVFKLALIKQTPAGTYDASTANYSAITGNNDEVSGTGYTAGGATLTNVSPSSSGTVAFVSFANPSWSSATFSTIGCMIYNSSRRQGTVNRSVAVFDFGGTQSVSSGTFSVLMPTANNSTAILRFQ